MTKVSNPSSLIPLYRALLGFTILAVVVLLGYFFLPERRERLLPDRTEKSNLFFDAENGGKTTAEWLDKQRLRFKCVAVASGIAQPYCGLSIGLANPVGGVDYSRFKRMELKINYKGRNKTLRLRMHNYNVAAPQNNSRETLKGLDVSFAAEQARGVLVIPHLGWMAAEGSEDGLGVIDIGLDLVAPIADGEHQIELEYADIFGPLLPAEQWYLGVALAWLIANLLFIARHLLVQERRIRNDTKRLSTLAHYSDDLQQESARYKKLSNVDALTGALNRNGFADEINKLAPEGRMLHNKTMMVIDLDHFKRVNDGHGHDAGDAVLRETAHVIQKNTRENDLFVRWGGEEFLLFCSDIDAQRALLVAEKIRSAVEALKVVHGGQTIAVTVSVGVGVIQHEETFDDLFKRADQALYNAKHMGRNCVVLSEPGA